MNLFSIIGRSKSRNFWWGPGFLFIVKSIYIHKIVDSTKSSNNMIFCLESEFYLPKRGCSALFSLEKRWICGDKCIFRVETFQAIGLVANVTNAGFGEVREDLWLLCAHLAGPRKVKKARARSLPVYTTVLPHSLARPTNSPASSSVLLLTV